MNRLLGPYLCLILLVGWLPAMAAEPVTGDIKFERKTKGAEDFPPAIFPHWVHRVKFRCFVCHNKTMGFEMRAGSANVTMDAINDGKFCGACHKGLPAFAVGFETCSRCHRK